MKTTTKYYVDEQRLQEIFDNQFSHNTQEEYGDWLDRHIETGEIEIVEFDTYEVSQLDYKPTAILLGQDGNIFNLMAIASLALTREGKEEKAKTMRQEITESKSYNEALSIIMKYVEVE